MRYDLNDTDRYNEAIASPRLGGTYKKFGTWHPLSHLRDIF
jgi:hypothetical protein